jgi:hypothetical protein
MYIHLAFEYFSHLACLSGLYRIETLLTQCLSEVGLAVPRPLAKSQYGTLRRRRAEKGTDSRNPSLRKT